MIILCTVVSLASVLLFFFCFYYKEQCKSKNSAINKRDDELKEKEDIIQKLKNEEEEQKAEYALNLNKIEEETKKRFAFHPKLVTPLLDSIDYNAYYKSIYEGVLQHSFDKPFEIQDVGVCAMVHSANTDEVYFTSLFDCTCKDYQYRHRPCKHTLYLAYLFGLLQIDQKERDSLVREYNKTALLLEKAKIEASLCNSELSEAKLKSRALKNENDKLENRNRNIRSEVDKIIGDAIEEATRITSEACLEEKKKK